MQKEGGAGVTILVVDDGTAIMKVCGVANFELRSLSVSKLQRRCIAGSKEQGTGARLHLQQKMRARRCMILQVLCAWSSSMLACLGAFMESSHWIVSLCSETTLSVSS